MHPYPHLIITILLTFTLTSHAASEDALTHSVSQLISSLPTDSPLTLGVANFTDLNGQESALGRYLAEEVVYALTQAGSHVQVVDRSRLNVLLKEQGLSQQGLMAADAQAKLGQLLGFKFLVTGVLVSYGDQIQLNLKLLDLEQARVLSSAKGLIPQTMTLTRLQQNPSSFKEPLAYQAMQAPSSAIKALKVLSGVQFALMGCQRFSVSIRCHFRVMPLESDAKLKVYGSYYKVSRFVDDQSRTIQATRVQLVSDTHSQWVQKRLVSGLEADVYLFFEDLGINKSKSMALLRLGTALGAIEFRDVDIAVDG